MATLECIALHTRKVCQIPDQTVICLGNFDGVHLAHRKLLRIAVKHRNSDFADAACCVLCFRTPSSDYLSKAPAAHLCTLEQKLDRFAEEGIEYAILCDFPDIRALSPKEFAEEILRDGCHCVAAVCGFNYRFGKNGAGSAAQLQTRLQCPVFVQQEITLCGDTVSSTRIRNLLSEGDTEAATKLLTVPFSVCAKVVHGKALGHRMGIPTINQFFPDGLLIPRHGVYITDCEIDGQTVRGISNVGVHPTVDSKACVNCETHLLNFDREIYGRTVTVRFLKFLRHEQKFDSLEALTKQIYADIDAARQYP